MSNVNPNMQGYKLTQDGDEIQRILNDEPTVSQRLEEHCSTTADENQNGHVWATNAASVPTSIVKKFLPNGKGVDDAIPAGVDENAYVSTRKGVIGFVSNVCDWIVQGINKRINDHLSVNADEDINGHVKIATQVPFDGVPLYSGVTVVPDITAVAEAVQSLDSTMQSATDGTNTINPALGNITKYDDGTDAKSIADGLEFLADIENDGGYELPPVKSVESEEAVIGDITINDDGIDLDTSDMFLDTTKYSGYSTLAGMAMAINNETTARANADSTLDGKITAEANTRQNADATLLNRIEDLEDIEVPKLKVEKNPLDISGDDVTETIIKSYDEYDDIDEGAQRDYLGQLKVTYKSKPSVKYPNATDETNEHSFNLSENDVFYIENYSDNGFSFDDTYITVTNPKSIVTPAHSAVYFLIVNVNIDTSTLVTVEVVDTQEPISQLCVKASPSKSERLLPDWETTKDYVDNRIADMPIQLSPTQLSPAFKLQYETSGMQILDFGECDVTVTQGGNYSLLTSNSVFFVVDKGYTWQTDMTDEDWDKYIAECISNKEDFYERYLPNIKKGDFIRFYPTQDVNNVVLQIQIYPEHKAGDFTNIIIDEPCKARHVYTACITKIGKSDDVTTFIEAKLLLDDGENILLPKVNEMQTQLVELTQRVDDLEGEVYTVSMS